MAKRGTVKRASVEQEDFIAKTYSGKRSASSGAADHDAGDVRTPTHLIECKMTGTFEKPAKSISIRLSDVEKIVEEARTEGLVPMLAYRIYSPDSPVANRDGYVDISARLVMDDELC